MNEKETGKMKNQNNTAQSAEKQSFLQKKNVEISFKRYAIDAMGAMALGLFASLLIGTIIKTLAENVGTTGLMAALAAITDTGELAAKVAGLSMLNRFCWILWQIGNYATMVTGVAMAAAIGYALDAPPLVLFSLCAVGQATNTLGGSGGPLAVLFVAILACEAGKLVSKETKIDILVTPAVTIIVGVGCAMVLARFLRQFVTRLEHLSDGQRIYSHSSWESLFLLSLVLSSPCRLVLRQSVRQLVSAAVLSLRE